MSMRIPDCRLLLLLLWLCVGLPLKAVVAYPGPVEVRQPDGSTLTIRLHGDEHFHYMTDASGRLLGRDSQGFYRPAVWQADGSLRLTDAATPLTRIPASVSSKARARRAQAREQQAGLRAARGYAHPPKTLVILAAFQDVGFQYANDEDARQAFDRLLNESGYSDNGATGSVRDYYSDNSGGAYVPEFVVVGPYQLPKEMTYYGQNGDDDDEPNAPQMAYDAVLAAHSKGVDLSEFDTDNDGCLDNIYIFYAGYGESDGGGANTVWPHSYYLSDMGSIGGLRLGSYACSAELSWFGKKMTSIGTFCHEFGHTLGLPDFYDTDYEKSGGDALGLGNISLMATGCYNNDDRTPPYLNAEELMELGWLQPEPLTAGQLSLPPIDGKKAYRLDTENPNEYFLFENRQRRGWDAYIYSHGLLIYHVDKSDNYVFDGYKAKDLWQRNDINVYPDHECMYPVRRNKSSLTTAFYPGGSGLTSFTPNTTPASVSWSSLPLKYGLYDIVEEEGVVAFRVKEENETVYLGGVVTNRHQEPLADALLYLMQEDAPSQAQSSRVGLRRQAVRSYTTLSDANGNYLFRDIPAGDYRLVCQLEGYTRFEQSLSLSGGSQNCPVTMLLKGEEDYSGTTSWAGIIDSYIGVENGYFAAAVRWDAADVQAHVGEHIGRVTVKLDPDTPSQLTFKISYGKRATVTRTLSSDQVAGQTSVSVDLLDDTTSLLAGEEVLVEIAFDNGAWIGVDNGPAVVGKGDLYKESPNAAWRSLSQDDFDNNWCIEADWYHVAEYVPMQSFAVLDHVLRLKVGTTQLLLADYTPAEATATDIEWKSSNPAVASVGFRGQVTAVSAGKAWIRAVTDRGRQQDSCLVTVVPTLESSLVTQAAYHVAALTWAGYGADSWQLRWTNPRSSESRDTTLSEPRLGLEGLSPSNNYQIDLIAFSGTEAVDSLSTTLQTLAVPVSPSYNALYVNTAAAARDSLVLLDVKTQPQDATLQWFWDGKAVEGPMVRWTDKESHWLEVRILDAQGRLTEMIRRKLTYPNENKQ